MIDRSDRFDRIGLHLLAMMQRWQYTIFRFVVIHVYRFSRDREEIDDRRTEQAKIVSRKLHIGWKVMIKQRFDFKAITIGRQRREVDTDQIDEQKFLQKGEIFQQQLIAAKRIVRFRP